MGDNPGHVQCSVVSYLHTRYKKKKKKKKKHKYYLNKLLQDFFASGMAFFFLGAGSNPSALLKLLLE